MISNSHKNRHKFLGYRWKAKKQVYLGYVNRELMFHTIFSHDYQNSI
jgi:hypothetical protein